MTLKNLICVQEFDKINSEFELFLAGQALYIYTKNYYTNVFRTLLLTCAQSDT